MSRLRMNVIIDHMKSKELKTYNLPEDRVLLANIDAKPNGVILLVFVFGLLLVAFKQYVWGVSIAVLASCASFVLPNKVLIEFYQDYMVLYNHASKFTCEIIYYDDVVVWNYDFGITYDTLTIKLVDDSTHNVDGYSKIVFENLMNRFLKDKKEKKKKSKNKV